jgi:hypothetical protein
MRLQESTESKPKNGGMTKHDPEIADVLRLGGRKISARLAADSMAAIKSMLLKKRDAQLEQRMQRAKLNGGSPISVDDPANREMLNANLLFHKNALSTKVPFPRVEPANGGIWVLKGTVAPPFDIADKLALPFAVPLPIIGDPTMSATANPNGQMSASVVTGISDGLNAGREHAIVGFYFYPPGPGTLSVWTSPTYSSAWKIKSMNNEDVFAVGSISLCLGCINAEGEFDSVKEDYQNITYGSGTGHNQESGVQKLLSTSLAVTPGLVNSCFVYLDVAAMALWPWSLASSMMSATVPSIHYEFVEKFSNQ